MNEIVRKAHSEKQLIVNEIKEKLEKAKSAVVIDYIGISVAQADAMRKKPTSTTLYIKTP